MNGRWRSTIIRIRELALRQQLMDDVGNDLDALVKYLQERELDHPERLVSLPPRRPVTEATASDKKPDE
jgi:hypothetical protein